MLLLVSTDASDPAAFHSAPSLYMHIQDVFSSMSPISLLWIQISRVPLEASEGQLLQGRPHPAPTHPAPPCPTPPYPTAVGPGQAEALGFFHISCTCPAPAKGFAHGAPFPHPWLLGSLSANSDAAEASYPRAAEWILRVELPLAGNLRSQSESPDDPVTEGEHTSHVVRGPGRILVALSSRVLLGAQAHSSRAGFSEQLPSVPSTSTTSLIPIWQPW